MLSYVSANCGPNAAAESTVDEVEAALLPQSGQSDPSHRIVKFEEALRVASGGLLEIRYDNIVGFIHISVMDFLSSESCIN